MHHRAAVPPAAILASFAPAAGLRCERPDAAIPSSGAFALAAAAPRPPPATANAAAALVRPAAAAEISWRLGGVAPAPASPAAAAACASGADSAACCLRAG